MSAVSDRYLTVDECAALLRVEHKTVRRLIERGTLPALRVGRVLRINPADLSRLAEPSRPTRDATPLPRARRRRGPRGDFARMAREASSGVEGSATVKHQVASATRQRPEAVAHEERNLPMSTSKLSSGTVPR